MSLPHVLLYLSALLATCSTPPKQDAQSELVTTEDDLMNRHETAMQQTSQLYELKSRIGSSPAAAPYQHGLLAADKAMMGWMHGYQPDTTKPAAERLAYLRQQQIQLTAIEKQLKATIDSAAAFAKQLPAPK